MPIDQVSPELERIVSLDQDVEVLGAGYAVGEGPLWWSDDQSLLFSEVRGNRRWKWSAGEGVTLVQDPTNNANGLTRDPQGRLVMCEGGARRVTRLEADGSVTTIGSSYHGRPLNRPNDVVVKSDGSIYFTDPGGPSPDTDLDFAGVYRVSADLSKINLLVRDYVLPNGLAFSPDESILYINDSQGVFVNSNMFRSVGRIDAFDVRPNGMLANRRVFCELRGERLRNTGWHESRRGGKRLLHRARRGLDYGRRRQAPGNNPDRGGAYYQLGLGRRRLEDAVHNHFRDPGPHSVEDTRSPGPGPGAIEVQSPH